jgi:hypothetical protein
MRPPSPDTPYKLPVHTQLVWRDGEFDITQEEVDIVLHYLADGYTLKKCSQVVGKDSGRLRKLISKYPKLNEQYEAARLLGLDAMADRLQDIHEQIEDTHKARLASENAKWLLSRLNSRKYGDKLDVNVSGTIDLMAAIQSGRERMAISSGITLDHDIAAQDIEGLLE